MYIITDCKQSSGVGMSLNGIAQTKFRENQLIGFAGTMVWQHSDKTY